MGETEQPHPRAERHEPEGQSSGSGPYLTDGRVKAVHSSVEHLHGPRALDLSEDEAVVVCLVRDSRIYVKLFIEHHLSLGARHIVFLDNGSVDGTVEAAMEYDNVTVLRSNLPFKDYKIPMKRYLTERFGQGCWSLCMDIDELFDWPYSDVVDLESLLHYLNDKGYTALMAQMLDMFPEEPLRAANDGPDSADEDLPVERHTLYDLSNLHAHRYEDHNIYGAGNVVSNDRTQVFSGGIRRTVFGANPTLTKHPLVFLDGNVIPVDGHVHRVSNARIADFTGVFFHYKFLAGLYEQSVRAVREKNYFNDSGSYKKYLAAMQQNPVLRIKGETSKKLESTNDLVDEGFLVVSEDYMTWVAEEEEKRADRPPGHAPYRLPGAIFRSRARLKTRAGKVQEAESRNKRLENELAQHRNKSEELQGENQKLMLRKEDLERRMRAVHSSRSWKIIRFLDRLKATATGAARGKSPAAYPRAEARIGELERQLGNAVEQLEDARELLSRQDKRIARLESLSGREEEDAWPDNVSYEGVTLPPKRIRPCGKNNQKDDFYLSSARKEAAYMVERLGLTPGGSLLDVGCGPGRIAIGVLKEVGEIRKYRGVDVSERSIEWAQRHITPRHPNFQFIHLGLENARYNPDGERVDDGFEFPFEENEFDIIWLFSVFTHMLADDVRVYLRDFQRVLRPKGRVLLTANLEEGVPDVSENPEGYRGRWDWSGPLHCVRYDRTFFENMLAENGFHVEEYGPVRQSGQKSLVVARSDG